MEYSDITLTCWNCDSFEDWKCTIRYVILWTWKRVPMLRKKYQKWCPAFMQKIISNI